MNKRFFNILEPIRIIGKYNIVVKFVEEVTFNLTLNVVPDEVSQKVISEHQEEQEKLKKLEDKEKKSEDNSEEELNKDENDQKNSSEITEKEDNNSNN